ncbi:heavy-metal-associated domain-containing protein [Streptomyces sp. H27-C3]|uniref:heavy-metal-associated domain-containing protein n=1 Tax=Streptomyces sp. H27-C3 TaxID=3046305 RepID=UPI0024B9EBFD|nr:heavy-metal-associated domain-containing protein [Streptomyces sp. H27-C3]MDJ0463672.1 heavy-metal-associated domain-containing protein [Streptomyces sp. H27-C3]
MTAETGTTTETTPTASCCSPTGSCHDSSSPESEAGAVTTVYRVTGMTCGHCEGAIAAEVSEIPGVSSVQAVSATGLVTVVSKAPLDDEAVRAAIDEAGYELTGRA